MGREREGSVSGEGERVGRARVRACLRACVCVCSLVDLNPLFRMIIKLPATYVFIVINCYRVY